MAMLSSLVKYGKLVVNQGRPLEIPTAVLFISMALVTAVSEEVLSRGFVLNRLYQESKNILTSSLYASFLFFFLHVPILFTSVRFSGNMIFYVMVTDLVLSLVNSLLYLERKSLMLPIMIHTLYSLTFYFFG
jgi:membrane protease YdiL (CAAX protease family)